MPLHTPKHVRAQDTHTHSNTIFLETQVYRNMIYTYAIFPYIAPQYLTHVSSLPVTYCIKTRLQFLLLLIHTFDITRFSPTCRKKKLTLYIFCLYSEISFAYFPCTRWFLHLKKAPSVFNYSCML